MLGEGGGGDPSNLVETCNRCPFHTDVLLVSMVFLGARQKSGHGFDSYMMSFRNI